jgi:hypothetical protein
MKFPSKMKRRTLRKQIARSERAGDTEGIGTTQLWLSVVSGAALG